MSNSQKEYSFEKYGIDKPEKEVVRDLVKMYSLKLHEESEVAKNFYVTRVPGGWIYDRYCPETDQMKTSTFVPFVPKHKAIIND